MFSKFKIPIPENENIRLKVLRQSQILDTPPEKAFDDITHLAAYICSTPVALISLIDARRQWFKSKVGVNLTETPRNIAFCAHTITRTEVLVVPDTLKDERFANNTLVKKDPKIRFYAGAPLITTSGEALGTLCVMDYVPRELAPEQLAVLQELTGEVVNLIQLRRNVRQLVLTERQHQEREKPVKKPKNLPLSEFFEQIGLGLGAASAILLVISTLTYRSLTNFIATSHWQVEHYQVLKQTEEIDDLIHRAIVAEHRYLISGEQRYLAPYYQANRSMAAEINRLQQLIATTDRPAANRSEQQDRVALLAALIKRKLAQIEYLIDIRRTQGLAAGAQAWREYQPVGVSNQIENTIAKIETSENQLLAERSLLVETHTRQISIAFVSGVAITFLLLAAVYYVIYSEIRRREQTEKQLQESQESYQSVVENVKEVIFQTNNRGFLTFLNCAWTEVTGLATADSLGTALFDYIYPSDREHIQELFQRLIKGKKANIRLETRYIDRDERVGWLEVYAEPIVDRHHQVIGIFGTLNNATERHQAQEVMKQQLAAVETAIDGIAILNLESEYIYINQAHVQMFGYKNAEQVLGKTWKELYPPNEIKRFETYVFPLLQQEGYWRGEAIGKKNDGQTFPEEVSLTLLENGNLICVCRNIAQRKQAEKQLKNSLKEKSILLKEVHHRVKNNLQVIDSLFRHQCRATKDPNIIQVLRECQNRVTSMALIHEKLYQSKDLANIVFCDYIKSLLKNLLDAYPELANNCHFKINVLCIKLDIQKSLNCGLIINELISNCLKYAFPDGKAGEIEIEFGRNNADRWLLRIKDNGVGMPADFDLHKSKSLGLKIVKILTNQLDGELQINSNGGAEFLITFPIQE
jgi:PAS domain S-box-containing protein